MEFNHKPVLLDECIEMLDIKPDGTYIDGTVGGAGHSVEIYKRLAEKGTLVGMDQDTTAIEVSSERLNTVESKAKLILVKSNFVNVAEVCREKKLGMIGGILLDLGVSSHQLDEAERGFSYQQDAPLDMRMDKSNALDAGTIVNEYDENRLREIIWGYGEERWASRIAGFIVKARSDKRIRSTGELVEIIKAAIPSSARREGPHPAKRTFQAIRIEVNNELGVLKDSIDKGFTVLRPGGRFLIISFHSLEDRIVKNGFAEKVNPCKCPPEFPVCVCGLKPMARLVLRKPITASEKELAENPRARSAKLRVLEKICDME